mgnify:CR=1 FL=1
MGTDVPKQFLPLAGVPVLVRTLLALQRSPVIDEIFLAVPAEDVPAVRGGMVEQYGLVKVTAVLAGGGERQESVGNALRRVRDDHEIVLVHDAVRPFVPPDLIGRVVTAAREHGAAAAGIPVRDTVKRVGGDRVVVTTVEREGLWLAQTPQAFSRRIILAAYERAIRDGCVATDDASLVERMGGAVRIVTGSLDNIKITTPEDLAAAESILSRQPPDEPAEGRRIAGGEDADRVRL